MNRKYGTLLVSIALMAALAACGDKPEAAAPAESANAVNAGPVSSELPASSEAQPNSAGSSEAPSPEPSAAPAASAPAEQTETIKVYYADQDFTSLTESTKEISYSSASDNEAGKYEAAFKALQDTKDSKLFPLWGKMQLLSVKFSDGLVTLDIHMPDEARLGADGELMAIDSLKKTLFQFDEVTSIDLLVDGAQLDTLMGHDDLEHPMTRD